MKQIRKFEVELNQLLRREGLGTFQVRPTREGQLQLWHRDEPSGILLQPLGHPDQENPTWAVSACRFNSAGELIEVTWLGDARGPRSALALLAITVLQRVNPLEVADQHG